MRLEARLLALQEILDLFLQEFKPLDHLLQSYFLQRRYAGSKDRKYIKDHIFCLFRHWQEIAWQVPQHSRSLLLSYFVRMQNWTQAQFQEITKNSPHSFTPLTAEEKIYISSRNYSFNEVPDHIQGNAPEFLWAEFYKTFKEDALSHAFMLKQEASTDVRVNFLKITRDAALEKLRHACMEAFSTPYARTGIRIKNRPPLGDLDLFQQGMIEIQDEGSQLLAEFCSVQPQDNVLDFCAGAGGKTLALGMLMHNKGRIVATDYHYNRLERMLPRLKRSGLKNIILKDFSLPQEPFESFDLVLVDSPCSGTGTWRRSPDLRLRLTEKDLSHTLLLQQSVLKQACQYVRPGGRLIYATCSLLQCENQEQIDPFLKSHPLYCLGRSFQVSPLTHGTDGFYAAELYKSLEDQFTHSKSSIKKE